MDQEGLLVEARWGQLNCSPTPGSWELVAPGGGWCVEITEDYRRFDSVGAVRGDTCRALRERRPRGRRGPCPWGVMGLAVSHGLA